MPAGTTGNDSLVGGAGDNTFDIRQGGDDTVRGLGGNDKILAGAALTSADVIDGGDGFNSLFLDGDYDFGVTFDDHNLINIGTITLAGGHDYRLTMIEAVHGPDQSGVSIDASGLGADDRLIFDGSTVTASSLSVYLGRGDDLVRGGGLNDYIDLGAGGDDTAYGGDGADLITTYDGAGRVSLNGGDGDDRFAVGAEFGLEDRVNGARGLDTLQFVRDVDGVQLLSSNVRGIEQLLLTRQVSLKLTDSFAKPALEGGVLLVTAEMLWAEARLKVDASAETDVSIHFTGSEGSDVFMGGALSDTFTMTFPGRDRVEGADGDDLFIFNQGGSDSFSIRDEINGGRGFDTLRLGFGDGIYALEKTTIRNVELITMFTPYDLILDEATVAKGRLLTIEGTGSIDGSAETDGRLSLKGGGFADSLVGGAGADTISGGYGGDTIDGGAGADRFVYLTIDDSVEFFIDEIDNLEDQDLIDLRAIDANTNASGDQRFKLVDAFTGAAGQAVLEFDEGADQTSLRLDVNGDGVADSIILIAGDHTDFDNFVL